VERRLELLNARCEDLIALLRCSWQGSQRREPDSADLTPDSNAPEAFAFEPAQATPIESH